MKYCNPSSSPQDLTSVQNLQKKHALLEADVGSHAERIDAIRKQADQFIEKDHFDADNIRAKRVSRSLLCHAFTDLPERSQ